MPELRDDGYPCNNCKIRQWYARKFDIHFSGEDCFWECEKYEMYKQKRKHEHEPRTGDKK